MRRLQSEKVLVGRVVQFSYMEGNKKQREYSATYVDMATYRMKKATNDKTFRDIGVYANYFARAEESNHNTDIDFQALDLIFKAGYLSMDHYVSTINEKSVSPSDRADATFSLPVSVVEKLIPQWKDLLSPTSDFVIV